MKQRFKDETGNKYGRLTVMRKSSEKNKIGALWVCRCDCGKEITVLGIQLRSGNTRSCGCLRDMPEEDRRKLGFAPHGKERVLVK